MIIKKGIYIILFLLYGIDYTSYSQSKNLDSIYLKKIELYKDLHKDSTLYYIKLLEKSKNICLKIDAKTAINYLLYRQKKYFEVENECLKIIKTIDSLKAKNLYKICLADREISLYNRLFWVKKNQEDYSKSYRYIVILERLINTPQKKDLKNYRDYLGIQTQKAIVKNILNEQNEALKILQSTYSKRNNPILKSVKNNKYFILWKTSTLNSIGNTYLALGKKKNNFSLLDSAKFYYDKAFFEAKKLKPQHSDSKILHAFNIVNVLIAKKKFKDALNLIDNYKDISNGFNYESNLNFQKTEIFFGLKNSDSTLHYANKSLKSKEEDLKRSKKIKFYEILSNQYNAINKIDSAYKYSKFTLKEYELARINKEETFKLQYKNDFEEAKKLNNQIKLKENKKRKKLIYLFSIISSLIIILVLILFKKNKKKVTLELELQKKLLNKKNESIKKEYNIDDKLESEIMNEIAKIDENLFFLSEDFSINYLAEKLNSNSTYISYIFNKNKNVSFKQYYAKKRIEYIIYKINTNKTYTKYTIQALAEEIGYANASSFTRVFKKHTGITPSEYIKNKTKKKES